jgi:hypothetical protein
MMIHVLAVDRLIAEKHHDCASVRELSDQEVADLDCALDLVGAFNGGYSLYEICIANYNELEDFYNHAKSITGVNLESSHNIVIEMNRLLLNYLSSFRTFIDHQERVFAHISTPNLNWLAHFKEQSSVHYDDQFSYRFLWNMRNYVQHCGLPLGGFSIRGMTNQEGKEEPFFSIYFERDNLLKNYSGWKKAVRDEIALLPKEIGVMEHVRLLQGCIEELSKTVTEIHIHRLAENWNFIIGIIKEALEKYPDGAPCLTIWNKEEDKTSFVGITPLPTHLILKVQAMWKEFDETYGEENA